MNMRLVVAAALICFCVACSPPQPAFQPKVIGGDVDRGASAMADRECGACHVIPGIRGARGQAGPPLDKFARHSYIAGQIPNTPDHLIAWLQDPPAMTPRTAMPAVGMDENEARDMAAFLYTLD